MCIAPSVSIAFDAISSVLRVRSDFEMIRVAAWRVIAGMSDDHAVGDRAALQLPKKAMSKRILARASG